MPPDERVRQHGSADRSELLQSRWPDLPQDGWRDTYPTLHMWTQIVGKVCLALSPLVNHYWNIAFQVTSRGLMTPTLALGDRSVTITFDFVEQELVLRCSDGRVESLALRSQSVADFYRAFMDLLSRNGVFVRIWTMPVEVPNPIRFDTDTTHHTYDPRAANAFWRILLAIKPVFERFRCRFLGKCSPVHFFWGSFDLAVTRFSGRRAPERPGADAITREAYSHEVISHGFWPGSGPSPTPMFYAYAAPEPEGLKQARIQPAAAYYSLEFSEFLLPYESIRSAADPERDLMAFLESSYDAAADLARWTRSELERV